MSKIELWFPSEILHLPFHFFPGRGIESSPDWENNLSMVQNATADIVSAMIAGRNGLKQKAGEL